MARPLKLFKDKSKLKRLLEAVRLGNTIEDSCKYAGIAVSTFYNYVNKAKEKSNNGRTLNRIGRKFMEFMEELDKAEAEGIVKLTRFLDKTAEKSIDVAKYILSKRRPQIWGDKAVQVNQDNRSVNYYSEGETESEMEIETDKLTPAEKEESIKKIEADLEVMKMIDEGKILSMEELNKSNEEADKKYEIKLKKIAEEKKKNKGR